MKALLKCTVYIVHTCMHIIYVYRHQSYKIIMPSKMEVASQHCDTVPNKTKDILDTVKVEKIETVETVYS